MVLIAQADEILEALTINFRDPLRVHKVLENLEDSRQL